MIIIFLKKNFPSLFFTLRKYLLLFSGKPDTHYPGPSGKELKSLRKVLYSGNWNQTYSSNGIHYRLEKEFANFIGAEYAISVNSGGVALQMMFRAAGIEPGDGVLHQVDTCVATAYAVFNSGAAPFFADSSVESFQLDKEKILPDADKKYKAILPVHVWGNPEDMDWVTEFARKNSLLVLEDSCLALGAEWKGKKTGTLGLCGAFSFGCLKPLQAGEGGMLVTNDYQFASRLRELRNWGESQNENGKADYAQLSWNGRMSEFVAAVALEQLKSMNEINKNIRENVLLFENFLNRNSGIKVIHEKVNGASVYSHVQLKLPDDFQIPKNKLIQKLNENIFMARDANFEPITRFGFFRDNLWEKWNTSSGKEAARKNYHENYPGAEKIFSQAGIGISRLHFLSRRNVKFLIHTFEKILSERA